MPSATVASDEPIVTKLYPAPARRSIVVRARLLEMLRRADDAPLCMIVAPAGYGKTTLLSAWYSAVRQRGGSCAWLSLDSGDNDPARFWAALVAALELADPALGAQLRPLLGGVPPAPDSRLVAALLNACVARQEPLLLALDDFHTLENATLIDAMAQLVDRAPPTLRLVIACRSEPPLPLPRWRVRDSVALIRANDLRFSADEVARLIMALSGTRLSAEAALALEARTEGWAAALVLASHGDLSEQPASPELFDYVVAEVLARQPASLRAFLLHTSLPERICAPLCDELTGTSGAEAMLALLERNNLFLVKLDEQGRWFRYHHLFAAALRRELQRSEPGAMSYLHARAAGWFERNGLLREAIGHALAAPDWPTAARLVAAEARPAMLRGEVASVTDWLRTLPAEVTGSIPELILIRGWLHVLDGDLAAADAQLALAQAGIARLAPHIAAELAALATIVSALRAEPIMHEPGSPAQTDDPFVRSVLFLGQGFAATWRGELDAAEQAYLTAAAGSRHGALVAVIALCQCAEIQAKRGALRRAEATYREALELVEPGLTESELGSSPLGGIVLIGLGMLAAERGDLAMARRRLLHGIAVCGRWGGISTFDAYLALAEVQAAGKEYAAAGYALDNARALSSRLQLGFTPPLLEAATAQLQAQSGELDAARAWLDGVGMLVESGAGPLVDDAITLAAARISIALGRPSEALERLEPVRRAAEAGGRVGTLVEVHILAARSSLALPDRHAARSELVCALELAAPEGMAGPFESIAAWDKGVLAELCASSMLNEVARSFSVQLGAPVQAAPSSPDALSARERQVLALLAADLGNAEVARRLVIAPSTVKKHVNHIYAKLGANNRGEALARARELGMLD